MERLFADSARITGVAASSSDSAFVWYSVANAAAGARDSLYLKGRSLSDTTVSDPGWAFIEIVKPNMTSVAVRPRPSTRACTTPPPPQRADPPRRIESLVP